MDKYVVQQWNRIKTVAGRPDVWDDLFVIEASPEGIDIIVDMLPKTGNPIYWYEKLPKPGRKLKS